VLEWPTLDGPADAEAVTALRNSDQEEKMSTRIRTWWGVHTSALIACCTVAVLSLGVAVAAAPARGAAATGAPSCSAANTRAWLGLGVGGGYAGGVAFPLEFTNAGRLSCTLYGYPGVSATRGAAQVGPAARRERLPHAVVTLSPGATAHAMLRIVDWGAVCTRAVTVSGLRVYAPNQFGSKPIDYSFQVCAHRGVLSVGPVRAGVGIPGY
jgi:hypothetical protein